MTNPDRAGRVAGLEARVLRSYIRMYQANNMTTTDWAIRAIRREVKRAVEEERYACAERIHAMLGHGRVADEIAAAREPAPVERECPAVLAVCAECDEPLAVGANLDAECDIEARVSRCDCKPAPVGEGDVVERAARVLDGLVSNGIDRCRKYARALHAAGLLAGAVDDDEIDRLAVLAKDVYWPKYLHSSGTKEAWREVVRAILREIGGGR